MNHTVSSAIWGNNQRRTGSRSREERCAERVSPDAEKIRNIQAMTGSQ